MAPVTVPNHYPSRRATLGAAASDWRRRGGGGRELPLDHPSLLPAHICTRVSLCLSLHQLAIRGGGGGSMFAAAGRIMRRCEEETTPPRARDGHQITGNPSPLSLDDLNGAKGTTRCLGLMLRTPLRPARHSMHVKSVRVDQTLPRCASRARQRSLPRGRERSGVCQLNICSSFRHTPSPSLTAARTRKTMKEEKIIQGQVDWCSVCGKWRVGCTLHASRFTGEAILSVHTPSGRDLDGVGYRGAPGEVGQVWLLR